MKGKMRLCLLVAGIVLTMAGMSRVMAAAGNKVLAAEIQGTIPVGVLSTSGVTLSTGTNTFSGQNAFSLPLGLWSRTIVQLQTTAPSAAGQIVYCNNCVGTQLCVSSGTAANAWVSISSYTAANASHCQ